MKDKWYFNNHKEPYPVSRPTRKNALKISGRDYQEALYSALRTLRLDDLLLKINRFSSELLLNNDSKNVYSGIRPISFSYCENKGAHVESQEIFVNGWTLIDLSYHAICASNDYRSRCLQDKSELAGLISILNGYNEQKEQIAIEPFKNDINAFSMYILGFGGEQFKFQSPGKALNSAARDLYILMISSYDSPFSIDVPSVVLEETGVVLENVVASLYLAWVQSTRSGKMMEVEDFFKNADSSFTLIDYKKVLGRYTTNYKEVQSNKLKRQLFYTKPYIRTQRGDTLSINSFLSLFLYEHSILWICRDHYQKQKSEEFLSHFGKLFEAYFEEVLLDLLPADSYERIETHSDKSADWKIQLGEYMFLVEQKSSLAMLSVKQQETDISLIKDFFRGKIFEALCQLDSSQSFYDTRCIKIILTYEEYFIPEIMHYVFGMKDFPCQNDGTYWLVPISEMEMLLHLYNKDPALFAEVVEEKKRREQENRNEGTSITMLLSNHGITRNEYMLQDKFTHYRDLARNIIKKNLV